MMNGVTTPELLSHPSWVCGLKLNFVFGYLSGMIVTPFVGVWIETRLECYHRRRQSVTPFVGVWIETQLDKKTWRQQIVTPFVGVWIETTESPSCCYLVLSHPSWVCGLKRNIPYRVDGAGSHTLRGCVD